MIRAAACVILLSAGVAYGQTTPVSVVDCKQASQYIAKLEAIMRDTPEPGFFKTLFSSKEEQEQQYKKRIGDIKTRIWIVRSSCPSY